MSATVFPMSQVWPDLTLARSRLIVAMAFPPKQKPSIPSHEQGSCVHVPVIVRQDNNVGATELTYIPPVNAAAQSTVSTISKVSSGWRQRVRTVQSWLTDRTDKQA